MSSVASLAASVVPSSFRITSRLAHIVYVEYNCFICYVIQNKAQSTAICEFLVAFTEFVFNMMAYLDGLIEYLFSFAGVTVISSTSLIGVTAVTDMPPKCLCTSYSKHYVPIVMIRLLDFLTSSFTRGQLLIVYWPYFLTFAYLFPI